MQFKIWCAFIAISFAHPVAAQEEINCSDIDPAASGSLTRMTQCIASLQSALSETLADNSSLERQQEAARAETIQLANEIDAINRLLSQAVIAFNRSERAGGACPRGWSLFAPAGGRVIIGAGQHPNDGLSEYPSYADDPNDATGGEERVKLTLDQMPAHSHPVSPYGWGHSINGSGDTRRLDLDDGFPWNNITGNLEAESRGGSKPHNNMPPYIALYFCKKD